MNYQSLGAIAIALGLLTQVNAAVSTTNTDGSVKLQYVEEQKSLSIKSDNEATARAATLAQSYGVELSADQLELVEVQESLTGTHYRLKQVQDGVDVYNAQFVVSTNKAGEVVKFYNATRKINTESDASKAKIPFISQADAIKIAWERLAVDGELLAQADAKIVIANDKNSTLIYKVELAVSSPYGHWIVDVNAHNGEVINISDEAIARKNHAPSVEQRLSGTRQVSNLERAMIKFDLKQLSKFSQFENVEVTLADGSATVFDPNPVVTLVRLDLQDTTDAAEFEAAYKNVELKDLSMINGSYHLKGPKVTLIDFESPRMDPSTSTNGSWDFKRKDVRFNDAMTYYHLDKSVRYMESLGYEGSTAIFPKSIEVDANGVNGSDNSHYIPSSRRLAFGHGCVDDNEDADVILHELGHAINHHINRNWSGGDTGAMGEGFGDYWAASYSVTTENGLEGNPHNVFKWDGHNNCWDGRKVNALNMRYSHSRNYYAHSRVTGGVSDELWSTPIFQAFLDLYKAGAPREDMDKIILESQYGLGSGIKMRDLATAIVETARELFPNTDYARVYAAKFEHHGIL